MSAIIPGTQFQLLAASGVQVPHTGDILETALATITVPANALGPNGILRIRYLISETNNGNTKTSRVRYSTISGTVYDTGALASIATYMREVNIINRNATNSQIGRNDSTGSGGWASTTNGVITSAVDTTAATTVIISGQLGVNTDTIALEFYTCELLRA